MRELAYEYSLGKGVTLLLRKVPKLLKKNLTKTAAIAVLHIDLIYIYQSNKPHHNFLGYMI